MNIAIINMADYRNKSLSNANIDGNGVKNIADYRNKSLSNTNIYGNRGQIIDITEICKLRQEENRLQHKNIQNETKQDKKSKPKCKSPMSNASKRSDLSL